MFGLSEISFDVLTSTPVIIVAVLLVLAVWTFVTYRQTTPPIGTGARIGLGTLRLIAISALVLALLEPVLGFSRAFTRTLGITVLVDRSASMDRDEAGKTRQARVDSLLSSSTLDELRRTATVEVVEFADRLASDGADLRPDQTALGDALAARGAEETGASVDYWILLSDGNSNAGREPSEAAASLTTPILAVDVARESSSFDIAIDDVDFNPIAFVGQPTEMRVRLRWQGAGEPLNLVTTLRAGSRDLASERLRVDQETGLADLTLRYTPTEPGQLLLDLAVPPPPSEELTLNNRRSLAVRVLKSKLNVLLASAQPDYEVGFLRRTLARSDKYDVTVLATDARAGNLAGSFPSTQTELNRYDVVILVDPDPNLVQARAPLLDSYVAERGGALWLLMGERFAARYAGGSLDGLLPLYPLAPRAILWQEIPATPVEGHLFHPSVRLADSRPDIRTAWQEVPPFRGVVFCDGLDNDATVVLESRESAESGSIPLVAYHRHGAGKALVAAATPFWTWAFLTIGYGQDNVAYQRLVEGTVNWLTIPDDSDPIRISAARDVYTRGEAVEFEATAFDPGFRPLTGVIGSVRLENEETGETVETDLLATEPGEFEAAFENLSPGPYRWTGRLEQDGRLLREQTGRLQVESYSLEEFDQSGDPATLQAIASATGGTYVPLAEFDRVIAELDLTPVEESLRAEVPIWGQTWLLFIFLGALAAEWLFRKLLQLL